MISRTVIMIMAITLIGKLMGILRDRMLGVYFGTYSPEGIAFIQASLLPRVFLDIMFASVLSASFIPVFNRYLETKGKEAAFELAASFIKIVFVVVAIFTIAAVIFAGPLYGALLGDEALGLEVRELGVNLLRIMFPIMLITSIAFSLTGILQSLGQFSIPAAMSVASNGVILLYYFFFIDQFGIYGLAAAFLIGWSMQIFIQIPYLIKVKFSFTKGSILSSTASPALKEIWQLTLPVIVASWLTPVNLLVATRAAAGLYGGEHGVVAINMAHTLYTVITGLFVLSLANVLFPALSKLAARENWSGYAESLRESLRGMLFLLLPMTFGLMALSRPLVGLVFQGGRFDDTSVNITATALFFFSLGIVGFGMQVILSRASFALQDGRGPLITGVLAMGINFVLSFTLAPVIEIGGPALASAIAISVAALGLFIRLARKLPESIWTMDMTISVAKMLVSSIIMYGIVLSALSFFTGNRILAVIVPAALGAIIYAAGTLTFGVPEARMGVQWFRNKLKGV